MKIVISRWDEIHFKVLLMGWTKAVRHVADNEKIFRRPEFLKIVAMKEKAIVLILREFERGKTHRLYMRALVVITRINPVPPAQLNRRRSKLEAVFWLQWGKERGYIK